MTAAMEVALLVAAALERCGIAYAIGGSLASSLSGEPRSTVDVDFVAALSEGSEACLGRELGQHFYLDADDLRRAVSAGSSANLIHHATGVKVDLFPAASAFQRLHLRRRQLVPVAEQPERRLYFYTAEDILLQKLLWYRQGGEASEQQWRDALGILRARGNSLDWPYLEEHATAEAIRDLLDGARRAIEPPPR